MNNNCKQSNIDTNVKIKDADSINLAGITNYYQSAEVKITKNTRDFRVEECSEQKYSSDFEINDLNLIKSFRLNHISFKDYLQIELNDHLIYIGPDNINYLRIEKTKSTVARDQAEYERFSYGLPIINTGVIRTVCESRGEWKVNPDFNLKPFLKEGINTFYIRNIKAFDIENNHYVHDSGVEMSLTYTEYHSFYNELENPVKFYVDSECLYEFSNQ